MTTFYSDYLYAKNSNEGNDYRKDILVKYNSYVNAKNETALIEFKHKTKESKNAIGYGKATFFFYMLEEKIGKKAFDKGTKILLKKYPYKEATYKNLREIYEESSGKELLDFFTKWVYKKGAVDFNLENIKLSYIKNKYVLKVLNKSDSDMRVILKVSGQEGVELINAEKPLTDRQGRVNPHTFFLRIPGDKLMAERIPVNLHVENTADEKVFAEYKSMFFGPAQ